MIASYLRVSTKQQKHDSQRGEIERWLKGNGVDLKQVRWYCDTETGKHFDRSAFRALQSEIFDGQVKTVICWRLDRLARRLREGIELLGDWADRGLRVVVVSQQIDFTGAVGRLLAAVMLGLAEIELEAIRDRQAAGIDAAKRRGVYKGRKRGTTKGKPARARELRERGLTVQEVATAMGVSQRTVQPYVSTEK